MPWGTGSRCFEGRRGFGVECVANRFGRRGFFISLLRLATISLSIPMPLFFFMVNPLSKQ